MENIIKSFLRQFKDFTVMLLLVCAVFGGAAAVFKGEGCGDSLIILAILVLNGVFGAFQELKAEEIIGETENERPTPLQRRLSEVGRGLCLLTAVFCIIIFFGGILRGGSPGDMLLLSVSLAAAVIPESLPAVVTVMLSAGICRLSAEGIYVRRLVCAECLGQIKAVFMNTNLMGEKEKEELKAAGISLIDKTDEKAFYDVWSRGDITAFAGENEADGRFMAAADIGCCLSKNTELYGSSHIIFENMSALPEAVKIGRGIYENIKKSLRYLLSCNIGELLCILTSVLIGFETPLLAVQLLMVNLITDCLPAIALGLEEPEEDIMKRKPEEDLRLFTGKFTWEVLFEGIVIGAVTLTAYGFGRAVSGLNVGRTAAFSVLCLSQLFHSYNAREKGLLKNKFLNFSFVCGFASVVLAAELPFGAGAFGLSHLGLWLWLDVIILSFLPFLIFKVTKK